MTWISIYFFIGRSKISNSLWSFSLSRIFASKPSRSSWSSALDTISHCNKLAHYTKEQKFSCIRNVNNIHFCLLCCVVHPSVSVGGVFAAPNPIPGSLNHSVSKFELDCIHDWYVDARLHLLMKEWITTQFYYYALLTWPITFSEDYRYSPQILKDYAS